MVGRGKEGVSGEEGNIRQTREKPLSNPAAATLGLFDSPHAGCHPLPHSCSHALACSLTDPLVTHSLTQAPAAQLVMAHHVEDAVHFPIHALTHSLTH